jgi:hypothetical protein
MQVNEDYVYCYGCKWSGDIYRLIDRLLTQNTTPFTNVAHFLRDAKLASPSGRDYHSRKYTGNVPISLIEYWHSCLLQRPEMLNILQQERLLTLESIKHFKLGYRPDKDAWVVPFLRGNSAEIVQFRTRKTNESSPKYWGLKGHNRGAIMNCNILDAPQDYVVILMGTYDPTLAWQDGLPAVGLNGSMPFKEVERDKVRQIFAKQVIKFIVPDNNPEEIKAAKKLATWIDGDVRTFPANSSHNTDYIDYRKSGKTVEDFKREVLGILPYSSITDDLFDSLCSLYDAGDMYDFAQVYLQILARGYTYNDVGLALANRYVSDLRVRRMLYNVASLKDFTQAMRYNCVLRGYKNG